MVPPLLYPFGIIGMGPLLDSWKKKSRWAEFLEADPRVSLVIDEPVPPIRKVICDGKAEMIEKGIEAFSRKRRKISLESDR